MGFFSVCFCPYRIVGGNGYVEFGCRSVYLSGRRFGHCYRLYGSILGAAVIDAAAPARVAAPLVGNTEQVSSKPDVDAGVPAETVAVISAAVASVAPAGTQYAVKGIRKL